MNYKYVEYVKYNNHRGSNTKNVMEEKPIRSTICVPVRCPSLHMVASASNQCRIGPTTTNNIFWSSFCPLQENRCELCYGHPKKQPKSLCQLTNPPILAFFGSDSPGIDYSLIDQILSRKFCLLRLNIAILSKWSKDGGCGIHVKISWVISKYSCHIFSTRSREVTFIRRSSIAIPWILTIISGVET